MQPFLSQDIKSVMDIINYAQQRIGSPIPVGYKRRSITVKRIEGELEVQRWTFDHLIAAVEYMKARGIKAKSFDYILYHVEPAIKHGFMPRRQISTWDDLDSRVADAIAMEDDDLWLRRLYSARGLALQKVYQMWETERLPSMMLEERTNE